MIRLLGRFLAKHRRSVWGKKVGQIIFRLHKGFQNLNYDFQSNGEQWVLEALGRSGQVSSVFDVGANHGEWSVIASRIFGEDTTVHAFEIVPKNCDILRKNLAAFPNVRIVEKGLSREAGSLEMFFDPERHSLATSVKGFSEGFHHYAPKSQILEVTTGDDYCGEVGISHVDFLKIDVEGAEPDVLEGFGRMLSEKHIDVIQFEYGYINIETKFLLKDFHEMLGRYGMRVGKIYPDHVDFKEYSHMDEDFYGPNYLAIRSEREDLIQLLSG